MPLALPPPPGIRGREGASSSRHAPAGEPEAPGSNPFEDGRWGILSVTPEGTGALKSRDVLERLTAAGGGGYPAPPGLRFRSGKT